MKINNIQSQTFGIKFVNNSAFSEVKKYAELIGKSKEFNNALIDLQNAKDGTVMIHHGVDTKLKPFSSFIQDKICVNNTPYDGESAVETTFRAIIDLANFGGRYKTLTNTNHINTRI